IRAQFGGRSVLEHRVAIAGVERRHAGAAQAIRLLFRHLSGGMLLRVAHVGWNAGSGPRYHSGGGHGVRLDFHPDVFRNQDICEPGKYLMEDNPGVVALKFDHVSVFFDDKPALDDVSLEVPAGETRILFGAAGSGKTVLLKTALGLIKPDAGRVI